MQPLVSFLIITLLTILGTLQLISLIKYRSQQTLRETMDKLAEKLTDQREFLQLRFQSLENEQQRQHEKNQQHLEKAFLAQQKTLDEHLLKTLQTLQNSLQQNMADVRQQISSTLEQQTHSLSQRLESLTQNTDNRLKEISGQVDKRLTEGFEKTNAIFTDVIKRLALIDEAQKKITELSSNVVDLQEILSDKQARGAFGEIQLSVLVHNVLPAPHFSMQHTLSNGKRIDCLLLLPKPTGNIAIDAKFPLENYRRLTNRGATLQEKQTAQKQFRQDLKKHIQDISEKYIIQDETAEGAMMFIPAEAIFAEIHANYPDLVETAQRASVWLVSPTTMMAILTTARAVLKDAATRKQVHIIQKHLGALAKDFTRFESRMNQLAKHIQQANDDVSNINISAKKISSRFEKIEQVELDKEAEVNLLNET